MADFSSNLDPALLGTVDYGDMVMVNGDFVGTSDSAQKPGYPVGQNPVLQHVIFRLRTFLTEWFLDSSEGVPWFQQLLVGPSSNPQTVDAVLKSTLLSTPGVNQLLEWKVDLDRTRRIMSVSFKATTVAGYIDYAAPIPLQTGENQ